MAEQNEHGVVKLVDAGVPADQGLSNLGLLMQLGGSVLAAVATIIAFTMLVALRGSGETLWMFVVLGMCIARSLMHRTAGTQLLYGTGTLAEDGKLERMRGIRNYILFGATQSLAMGGLLVGKYGASPRIALGVTVALALWPATLFVLMQLPRFKRFKDDVPLTEDKGFEGASILMTVLGTCGLMAVGTALLVSLDKPGSSFNKGAGVLIVLALVMLVIRSVLHVLAGVSGLRETNVDRSVELANRYANFGVISSFCAGGAMLLFLMTQRMNVLGLAGVVGECWMLMAWPLIIRRFFSDRQFADILAGDEAPIHRRSPDAGLTGLGWLLFAHAIYTASFVIVALAISDKGTGGADVAMMIGGITGVRSIWFSVGMVILQAWAGFELIRMSPQSRIVATVFGLVGAAVTLYINWSLVKTFDSITGGLGAEQMMQIGPVAISLILPIATIALVHRKIAPTARARFRTKAAPKPPSA